jgi:hypothetical protein
VWHGASDEIRRVAAARGVSIAATIRSAIEDMPDVPDHDRQELIARALEVIGKYSSGLSDISVNHDAYLEEIYAK